ASLGLRPGRAARAHAQAQLARLCAQVPAVLALSAQRDPSGRAVSLPRQPALRFADPPHLSRPTPRAQRQLGPMPAEPPPVAPDETARHLARAWVEGRAWPASQTMPRLNLPTAFSQRHRD